LPNSKTDAEADAESDEDRTAMSGGKFDFARSVGEMTFVR
jgi:hypothetical protein